MPTTLEFKVSDTFKNTPDAPPPPRSALPYLPSDPLRPSFCQRLPATSASVRSRSGPRSPLSLVLYGRRTGRHLHRAEPPARRPGRSTRPAALPPVQTRDPRQRSLPSRPQASALTQPHHGSPASASCYEVPFSQEPRLARSPRTPSSSYFRCRRKWSSS